MSEPMCHKARPASLRASQMMTRPHGRLAGVGIPVTSCSRPFSSLRKLYRNQSMASGIGMGR